MRTVKNKVLNLENWCVTAFLAVMGLISAQSSDTETKYNNTTKVFMYHNSTNEIKMIPHSQVLKQSKRCHQNSSKTT